MDINLRGLLMSRIAERNFEMPERVMVSPGYADTMRGAMKRGVVVDVIFIRDDGWTLAAPEALRDEAYEMWKDKWVGFIMFPFQSGQQVCPIEKYTDRIKSL